MSCQLQLAALRYDRGCVHADITRTDSAVRTHRRDIDELESGGAPPDEAQQGLPRITCGSISRSGGERGNGLLIEIQLGARGAIHNGSVLLKGGGKRRVASARQIG